MHLNRTDYPQPRRVALAQCPPFGHWSAWHQIMSSLDSPGVVAPRFFSGTAEQRRVGGIAVRTDWRGTDSGVRSRLVCVARHSFAQRPHGYLDQDRARHDGTVAVHEWPLLRSLINLCASTPRTDIAA